MRILLLAALCGSAMAADCTVGSTADGVIDCQNGGTAVGNDDTGSFDCSCDCSGIAFDGATCADVVAPINCSVAAGGAGGTVDCQNGGTAVGNDGGLGAWAGNECTCDCSGIAFDGATCADVVTPVDCTNDATGNDGTINCGTGDAAGNDGGTGTWDCSCDCAAVAFTGDNCEVATPDPECTCTGGTAATFGDQVTDLCTAETAGEYCTECQAYAAAEEDDNDANTTEEPEKAGYTLVEVAEEKDGETVTTPWSSTCVAYQCTCTDPADNTDGLDGTTDDGDAENDIAHAVDENGDPTTAWVNNWAPGVQTIATGIWCTVEGGDICVADPPKCGADYECGDGWTIIADAATTEGATDGECCTEDSSEDPVSSEDDAAEFECTCADDAADTCADAVKEDTVVDQATCEAVDGGAWTEVKEAESEEDASSAAMASAVVALVSLLL